MMQVYCLLVVVAAAAVVAVVAVSPRGPKRVPAANVLVQVSGKDLSIPVRAPPSSAVALRPLNQIRKYIWIGRRGAGKATPPLAQVGIDQSRSAKANVFRAPAGPLEHWSIALTPGTAPPQS